MKPDSKNIGTEWWEDSLTRRQAGKRIAGIGLSAALLSAAGVVGCGDSEETFNEEETAATQKDALEVQKELGWDAGADGRKLNLSYQSPTDSEGSLDWSSYLDPNKLREAYAPNSKEWEKFVSPTLMQSLSQKTLATQIQPVVSPSMKEAYSRGLGMKELLKSSKDPGNKALVVDLPGPEAVAYAAALADIADPVLTFDNWPHPNSVVPAGETLGALVYYAAEVEKKRAERPKDAPPVFILDSNRLADYKDDGNRFDNRYAVTMPTAANLESAGVKNLLYAVPSDTQAQELDDLNEDFVAYREKGVNVSMVPLTDFKPVTAQTEQELGAVRDSTGSTGTNYHRTYYYGGHPGFSPFFFSYYPMFIPAYRTAAIGTLPSPGVRRPNYAPSRRPTMFSSRTTGSGRTGVGKQKPSGFGRVSVRSGSNGRTVVGGSRSTRSSSGSRSSGRSGSFGRSSGRGFSG